MAVSVFDLFSIGIGPSSSHTVGPMRAAHRFLEDVRDAGCLAEIYRVTVDLYGSLALTGKGHGTDSAVLLGLEGDLPELVDPDSVEQRLDRIRSDCEIQLGGTQKIRFEEEQDLLFHMNQFLPYHANGMRFTAFDRERTELIARTYYSVGGGFIVDDAHVQTDKIETPISATVLPFTFRTGQDLLQICQRENKSVAEIMMLNELTWRTADEIRSGLLGIWEVMKQSVERGCKTEGMLPGGLNVRRRAVGIARSLGPEPHPDKLSHPSELMDWVSLWALAVNEENAAGGRIVTAPTNGAAGVIPAVLHYYDHFVEGSTEDGIVDFMLTAGAIGILYKLGASISAAEVGCQGEVGVACSMAAGALAAVMGATVQQVEDAAEIGMEHNLGLTCDPVGGLVQIPCIERNTMGAIKAINAARLALRGDGSSHKVTLDQVIKTMWQTGKDMQSHYKETSQGGLSVNVIEC